MLGALEIDLHIEVFPDLGLNIGHCFDQRQFIYRLRVVGHRTIRVDRDRHRPHAQESERHQSEREHCRRQHSRRQRQSHRAHVVGKGHQGHHGEAEIVAGEIAGDEAGQNSERRSAFLRRDDHFLYVPRMNRGERLHQLRNERSGESSAGDDYGQFPPLSVVATEHGDDVVGNQEGEGDGDDGGDPDQRGQGMLEVHLVRFAICGLGDDAVEEVGNRAGHEHHDAHDEDPDQ